MLRVWILFRKSGEGGWACEKERDHSRGELQNMMVAATRTKRGHKREKQRMEKVKFQPIAWKIVLLLYIKFDKENKKNQ